MNNCPICQNKGYVFFTQDGFAKAKQCQCSLYCDICNNFGYTEVYKDGYRFLKKCQCQILKEKIKKYNNAEIPSRYSEKKVSDFILNSDRTIADSQRGVLKEIRYYITNFELGSKGYILYGGNGVGKTHLLTAIMTELILNYNVSGFYVDFPQWIKKYKQAIAYKDESVNLTDMVQKLYNTDILIIDEFGKNRTEFEISLFEEIFNERYNKRKIMLIGTNFEMTANNKGLYMKDFIPIALFSRLGDSSAFVITRLEGDDYRIYN